MCFKGGATIESFVAGRAGERGLVHNICVQSCDVMSEIENMSEQHSTDGALGLALRLPSVGVRRLVAPQRRL